uniref:Uncharacterized protein n=1 Tax=Anopheles culicifacies TaxID=139723 RepID=A0A182LU40_9DIPT
MKLASVVVLALVAVGVSAMPRPNADHREKLREYMEMIPEDIRAELITAIRNHEKPSDAFFEKVRQELLSQLQENQRFREFAEQKYKKFLDMLTPELRDEVDTMTQGWINGGVLPHTDEALSAKLKQHFQQLKQSHFEQFLSKLSPTLREQVQAALDQAHHGRPHFSNELRDAVRQHFQKLKEPQML